MSSARLARIPGSSMYAATTKLLFGYTSRALQIAERAAVGPSGDSSGRSRPAGRKDVDSKKAAPHLSVEHRFRVLQHRASSAARSVLSIAAGDDRVPRTAITRTVITPARTADGIDLPCATRSLRLYGQAWTSAPSFSGRTRNWIRSHSVCHRRTALHLCVIRREETARLPRTSGRSRRGLSQENHRA